MKVWSQGAYGEPCPGDGAEAFTFPTPERLASVTEGDLKGAKLGFRARYILELARRVAGGELDLDGWCRERDLVALRTALLGIKGVTLRSLPVQYTRKPLLSDYPTNP